MSKSLCPFKIETLTLVSNFEYPMSTIYTEYEICLRLNQMQMEKRASAQRLRLTLSLCNVAQIDKR